MAPLGIQFSPPVLAMELSPHGSLRRYLDEGKPLHQADVHQVALQVMMTYVLYLLSSLLCIDTQCCGILGDKRVKLSLYYM